MSFTNQSVFICSLDNSELIDIYDPNYDDDDYLRLPENFNALPLAEQETLKARHQTLVETLDRFSREKREKYLNLISERDAIILVCPVCKKVYDSKSMLERELYHSSNNMLPIRKPRKHGVVSDDRESVENAKNTMLDTKAAGARQLFFPNPTEEQEFNAATKDNRTVYKFKQDMKDPNKIAHAKNHLTNLMEKFGKENIDIQINVPDE